MSSTWRIEYRPNIAVTGNLHAILDKDRYPMAFVPAWDRPGLGEIGAPDEARANARLICAAPDLLATLERVRTHLSGDERQAAEDAIRRATQP